MKTDGESYMTLEKGAYVLNKDKEPVHSYSDLTETEYKHIDASVTIVKDAFASLLKFYKQPSYFIQLSLRLRNTIKQLGITILVDTRIIIIVK